MTLPIIKLALEPVVRRHRMVRLCIGLGIAWLAFAGLAFAASALGLGGSGVAVLITAAAAFTGYAIWKGTTAWEPDYTGVARDIERRHPDLHALILTAVEQRPDAESREFNYLQQRVVADAVREMRRRDCVSAVPAARVLAAGLGQFALLALLGFSVFSMKREGAGGTASGVAKIENGVSVTPGDVEVERGSGLVVLAKFGPEVPSEATLVLAPKNAPVKRLPLVKNLDDPVFGGGLPEVDGDLTYRVEYAGKATRDFQVKVFEHPRLDRADARLRYPEFAGLPEKSIPDTRSVTAVEGATLDVEFQLNKPVKTASLVSKDGAVIALSVDGTKPVAELRGHVVRANAAWELRLVDAEGRPNKLPAHFTLQAVPNRRPDLKFVTPKGDQRVSSIEEVAFRAEAWDDFGLSAAGITYSIGGGEPKDLPLVRGSKADERVKFEHTLKLEEIGVKVDELVSWYLWAEDRAPDGKPRRTQSDMFFAEVRPFEEIYRPGDGSSGGQQQGGAGGEVTKLADLQKQIITATWNLKRAEDGNPEAAAPGEKYRKDIVVVKDSQAEALGMATKLAEKIEDPKSKGLVGDAMQEMERALGQLALAEKTVAPLPEALSAEQSSYNALLKIAAHEFRVSRSKNSKGKGQQGDRNRAQLDELEMKDEKKRYEAQSEAQQQQNEEQREQLAVLNRLKELAQRQQDINERVKELQTALQEAKTEQEREEARRQLKRLREEEQQLLADADELRQKLEKEENQSRFAGERKQLEQTRADAQRAAESMQKGESSRALAEGKRAEEGFQKMRDELRKRTSGQFKEEMRQMRTDARELAGKQKEIAEQLASKPGERERRTLDGASPREKLREKFEQQQEGLGNVREQMQRVSERAEIAEPLLHRQLYDALRENTQAGTDDTLQKAGELARRGYLPQAQEFEEKARGEVDKLKTGVERAAESVLGDEAEALRQARAELDALNRELDREIARARPDLAANPEAKQQGESVPQGSRDAGQQADSRGQREGSEAAGKESDPKAAQPGEGQPGERRDGKGGEGKSPESSQSSSEKGEGKEGERQPGKGENDKAGQGEGQKGEASEGKGQEGKGQQGKGQGQGEGESQSQSEGQGEGQQGKGKGKGQGQGEGESQQPGQQSQGQGKGPGQSSGGGEESAGAEPKGERGGSPDGKPQRSRLAELSGAPRERGGIRTGSNGGGGPWGGGAEGEQGGPITGGNFVEWSDRLRNVEEMLDSPELRREVVRIREAAKAARAEFKRHSVEPKWDLVKAQVGSPLAELRNRVTEELARRDSKDARVPIDRDPVPSNYAERVRRYYEELGRSR